MNIPTPIKDLLARADKKLHEVVGDKDPIQLITSLLAKSASGGKTPEQMAKQQTAMVRETPKPLSLLDTRSLDVQSVMNEVGGLTIGVKDGYALIVPGGGNKNQLVLSAPSTDVPYPALVKMAPPNFAITFDLVQSLSNMYDQRIALNKSQTNRAAYHHFLNVWRGVQFGQVATVGRASLLTLPAGFILNGAKKHPLKGCRPLERSTYYRMAHRFFNPMWDGESPEHLPVLHEREEGYTTDQTKEGWIHAAFTFVCDGDDSTLAKLFAKDEVNYSFYVSHTQSGSYVRWVARVTCPEYELEGIYQNLQVILGDKNVKHLYGGWDVITGDGNHAYYNLLPGKAHQPGLACISFEEEQLRNLLSRLRKFTTVEAEDGDLVPGLLIPRGALEPSNRPLTLGYEGLRAITLKGPTRSGKSMLALKLALEFSPKLVYLQFSAGAAEPIGPVVKALGGQVLQVPIPPVMNAQEYREALPEVTKLAHRLVANMVATWWWSINPVVEDPKLIDSLMTVLQFQSGNRGLIAHFVREFGQRFREEYAKWWKATGEKEYVSFVFDDIVGLAVTEDDTTFGELPNKNVQEYWIEFQTFCSQGRKYGMQTWSTIHSMENIPKGILDQVPLMLELTKERYGVVWNLREYKQGTFYNPYKLFTDAEKDALMNHPEYVDNTWDEILAMVPLPDEPPGFLGAFDYKWDPDVVPLMMPEVG